MADFNLTNIRELTKEARKDFNTAFKQKADETYKQIATVINTKSHTVDYAWLGDVPAMKEWITNRQLATLKDYIYTIAKKDFESSISVMRDDFIFDNLGIVKPKINQLAGTVVKHYNSLVMSLITTNAQCFDGKKFFDTHVVKVKGTNKNFTNKSTKKLTEDEVFKAIEFMTTITDENGEPLGANPTSLIVAPNLLKTAKTILGAKQIEGTDNIAHNLLELKVSAQMPANSWCVLDTSQELKPFILQITKKAKLEEDTSEMFKAKKVNYGVDAMHNAGYGFWQMAYFSDGSAA